ncbi:hypothetical protein WMF04_18000 [Sorangium sp. So ce260]|uniref:hypothetical protein n=1 Tax=Sorangium sp. So ce260 TaxID=3133291 RepID=UPI003F5DA3A6
MRHLRAYVTRRTVEGNAPSVRDAFRQQQPQAIVLVVAVGRREAGRHGPPAALEAPPVAGGRVLREALGFGLQALALTL